MKRKIMHILRPVEGGIKEHLRLLAENLSPFYDVLIVCPPEDGLVSSLERAGAEVIPLNIAGELKPVQDLKNMLLLAGIIKKKRADILHLHGFKAGLLGRLASFTSLRVPVVLTVHNYIAHQERSSLPPFCFYFAENILSRRTSRIIAVSEALKKNLSDSMGIPDHKIIKIYNGINFEKFSSGGGTNNNHDIPEPKNSDGISTVGTAARFAPQKGVADLLRAARLVIDKGMRCKFLIAGDGPLRKELEEQVRSSGLQNHVQFLGHVADMPIFLNSLDIFVLPSRSEGLSVTLLEALAAGKPVVATRVGGVPEIITDGVNGYLVPAQDSYQMAGKIIELLENSKRRNSMSEKGILGVKENFTVQKMIDQTRSLYEELLL